MAIRPFLVILLLVIACNQRSTKTVRSQGEVLVSANFDYLGRIQGKAQFVSVDGKLKEEGYYVDGIRQGGFTTYYTNGEVRDSVSFLNGAKNGLLYNFDSLGKLTSSSYFFSGLAVGPSLEYVDSHPSRFEFRDFEKTQLVLCSFDSSGNMDSIYAYQMAPRFISAIRNGKKMIDILVYLPAPPSLSVDFLLGVEDSSGQRKRLAPILSKNVFFDTTLEILPNGSNYYFSAQLINKTRTINKIYLNYVITAK